MFCKVCGTQLNDGAMYCPKCGTQIGNKAEKKGNKKIIARILFVVVVFLLIIITYMRSISVDNLLDGYWITRYYVNEREYASQIEFKNGKKMKADVYSMTDKSGGMVFSGEVTIDKDRKQIFIKNGQHSMVLKYKKDGKKMSLYIEKYWCSRGKGDYFIDNIDDLGIKNIKYIKK